MSFAVLLFGRYYRLFHSDSKIGSRTIHVATVASNKVALSRLGRKWYENVDKMLKALILTFHPVKIDSNVIFMAFYALKSQKKYLCCYLSILSTVMKRIFLGLYAPQKILEDRTKDEMLISIDFSIVRSPNRVLTPAEKGLENAHFIVCNPFQNLRFGRHGFLQPSQPFLPLGCRRNKSKLCSPNEDFGTSKTIRLGSNKTFCKHFSYYQLLYLG